MLSPLLHIFLLPILLALALPAFADHDECLPELGECRIVPNHRGGRHPKSGIGINLPSYPPKLPEWLSQNLTCFEAHAEGFKDASKHAVLYVSAHFCANIAALHQHEPRPLTKIEKVYDTWKYYQLLQDKGSGWYKVTVEDMGEDCKVRWGGRDEPMVGKDKGGWATKLMPIETEGREWVDVLHPFGVSGSIDPSSIFILLFSNSVNLQPMSYENGAGGIPCPGVFYFRVGCVQKFGSSPIF